MASYQSSDVGVKAGQLVLLGLPSGMVVSTDVRAFLSTGDSMQNQEKAAKVKSVVKNTGS